MLAVALLFGLTPLAVGQHTLVVDPKTADNQIAGGYGSNSIPIDISSLNNNRGFAMAPNTSDFDGFGSGYPAQYLPASNFSYSGIDFMFPQYRETGNDNVLAQGQILTPPKGRYFSIHMLAAGDTAIATGEVIATYTDNTTTIGQVIVDPFWAWTYTYGGDIIFPYYLTNSTINYNTSMIFRTVNHLDPTKELTDIKLPNVTFGSSIGPGGGKQETRLHIFAVSLVPAVGTGLSLNIEYARSTNSWFEGTNKTQLFEVVVNNVGDEWVLANHSVQVSISAAGLKTIIPGVINRLRPGDRAIVEVGTINAPGTESGSTGQATAHVAGVGVQTSSTFSATFGIKPYEPTYESIYSHESPPWYSNGKFGIFVHWGIYSASRNISFRRFQADGCAQVPGWGNVGNKEQYAEWYWWWMGLGPNGTKGDFYEYNLATYGPNHVYDEFIQNFTAEYFDPKEWVDLFADSGAQYFVQVSKHHEGYALFDLPQNVSQRTSVAQFPHRNLLQELFHAADRYQPSLHKATYYSLPEWFHPDYKQYGFGWWPGGNATNPYTNQTLPYTGYVPVNDYVSDLILPEMFALADMGTEIMWCDIGGPNLTAEFASRYFNDMAAKGKQVVLNNRCGIPGDFDTPEYARYEAVQIRKWESNLGLDPYSYGYNRATPTSAYMKPQDIVTSLVDIVSKNGNFLLDIGPMANGTIVQVEKDNLRAAGRWIHGHAEAIFNTTYWFITPQEGDAVRFTQNGNAFYILLLDAPNATLVLDSPVPYVDGDEVSVVGGNMNGTIVESGLLDNGSLMLTIGEEVREADEWCWVFKIPFGGVSIGAATNASGGPSNVMSSMASPRLSGVGNALSLATLVVVAAGVLFLL